jgi:Na+-transporting NADH:ubiquinone oxidoreductase subunit C
VCLQGDLTTICGLTFHDHAETPGLGAEVDNPRWKARWVGRRAFDDAGAIRIEVARGPAGPPDADPFRVDGISGATITSRGVTHLLHFWLGEHGYGPYLDRLEEERPR